MAGIFKAYDIRGIVGDALNPDRAYLIGRALAQELFINGLVVVSRDMRTHSPELADSLMQGLTEGGCNVRDYGLCATPMNYWAIVDAGAAGGVQVTASHNGPQYNGFKVSGAGGVPIDFSTGLDRVEAFVNAVEAGTLSLPTKTMGTIETVSIVVDPYLDWMQGFVKPSTRALKIGADCANGMGGFFLPGFFKRNPHLSAAPLFWELDGTFPNHEADPLKAENLVPVQNFVTEQGCDFGVSYDGDADRCMFVDETGATISSDLVTALIAQEMLQSEKGPILYDLRSSHAVPEAITEAGGEPVRNRVGHSFMKRTLRQTGAQFGGELSGHYYFRACNNTDSGLMAMIQVLNILGASTQPLSALIAPFRRYSATGEINYRVPDVAQTLQNIESHYGAQGAQLDHLDGLTVQLADWWFNLRSSNTEPLLRLNLEARNPSERDAHLAEVQNILGAAPVAGH